MRQTSSLWASKCTNNVRVKSQSLHWTIQHPVQTFKHTKNNKKIILLSSFVLFFFVRCSCVRIFIVFRYLLLNSVSHCTALYIRALFPSRSALLLSKLEAQNENPNGYVPQKYSLIYSSIYVVYCFHSSWSVAVAAAAPAMVLSWKFWTYFRYIDISLSTSFGNFCILCTLFRRIYFVVSHFFLHSTNKTMILLVLVYLFCWHRVISMIRFVCWCCENLRKTYCVSIQCCLYCFLWTILSYSPKLTEIPKGFRKQTSIS